ncbi:MAG TPA: carbohydrate ABC transporter permease [Candidatus Acetatifactor stercoripullorum]|uniref:Carbohydrate ABC transporter permease n=1 Tax=Candidatus Acetatifactor stercoripullorum TaxID=2838414 RepID=A0A9D1R4U5_9FIRM|nr:carbohydrate ABC transporter permease [uncultured Acetatifactor sp.]HIW81289.1 carbohydrate ABC transporter permease [Candidatus Acetatifactor stercoripullorum]
MEKLRGKKMSLNDRLFVCCNYLILGLILVIALYPLIFVVSASVSDPVAVTSGDVILLPVGFTLDGYKYIMQYQDIFTGYANTILYTVGGTLLNLAVTLPCAYALSRKDLPGRGILMKVFIVTMYFSGGLIPMYLNIRDFHLLDTRLYMMLGGLVSVYNLIVSRTFFAGISWELHEAAMIDGCSDFKIFAKLVLPLSKPVIVVMALYYGVGHWNEYFNAMIYLSDRGKYPLQLILREILIQSKIASTILEGAGGAGLDAGSMQAMMQQADLMNLIKYGVIVVSTLPMLIVFPWLQKYFEKGVMIGSVKG